MFYVCLHMPTWWRGAESIHGEMREGTVSHVVGQVHGGEAVNEVQYIRNVYFLLEACGSQCFMCI
jgi:hypothetical protein